ncbi:DNA-formamidopyrimidine glycosylase [Candidatus Nomurabacteria bacterium RIFCSPLOWO2_02_FULL_40_10]|uniref:DNA-formamidopyrimidine glycosylase n=2 Tax=Candidatus Nomuraibacteriota TaxID=1752729 RepID=A0A1F6XY89_9BACT|nr:MAG: DNA-formamidopyrimidine glycosylase [Candidatus Nomurabacteria bacterium RIFCSPHIGHO2_01_FULL_39_10]OGI99085.1 MAG: DNA-formamidopyrimidine glycosylase [Candidatus Nomurabacteria bacterium RIFCSPLOWO2_02_FULL_40_10]
MPELPEVETTTKGLRGTIVGLTIKDVWTDLATKDKRQREAIANPKYFPVFKKEVLDKKVLSVERRAKNILINISGNKTILVHMKMTGHLMYGDYKKDPINRFIHFTISFNNEDKLYFSDARKFGKITLLDTKTAHDTKHLNNIGPEPLEKKFKLKSFLQRFNRCKSKKIKTTLMDQSVIAGIGNIYSDEILWRASVNPERKVSGLKEKELKLIFAATKETLKKGIEFGGDSMSDYRNIHGLPGKFQLHHEAYRRTGEKCRKKGCKGIIKRKVINGRSAHFCSVHQI